MSSEIRDDSFGTLNASFETSNEAFETLDEAFQTSNESFETSDDTFEVSNEAFETSDEAFEVSDDTFQTSNEAFQISNASFRLQDTSSSAANKALRSAFATNYILLNQNVTLNDPQAACNGSEQVRYLPFAKATGANEARFKTDAVCFFSKNAGNTLLARAKSYLSIYLPSF